jgi:16S rRNA (cytosine1402-N4)-methyltransferase
MNKHIPVLLDPIIGFYKMYNQGSKVFDGTFGGGGYSQAFVNLGAFVDASDLDNNALDRAFKSDLLNLKQGNFADVIGNYDNSTFDMIVVDLGFSNNQLLIDDKGFSYQKKDQVLDLRYDNEQGQSASDYLLTHDYDAIRRVLFDNSGEQFSNKIATKIVEKREKMQTIKVSDLEAWVVEAIPMKFYNKRNQVLSRVWQALRIHINQEFDSLRRFLETAPNKLKVGGVLCVVNFHSLEDKITTKKFRDLAQFHDLDNYGNKYQNYELLSKKPIVPDEAELDMNQQSRSATLRVIRKCREQS